MPVKAREAAHLMGSDNSRELPQEVRQEAQDFDLSVSEV